MKVLLLYFLIINCAAFFIAGYDKNRAVKNKRRIPENTLFILALFGGSPGLFLAMLFFKHKTSKTSFIVKFCGILSLQFLLIYILFRDKI